MLNINYHILLLSVLYKKKNRKPTVKFFVRFGFQIFQTIFYGDISSNDNSFILVKHPSKFQFKALFERKHPARVGKAQVVLEKAQLQLSLIWSVPHSNIDVFTIDSFKIKFWNAKSPRREKKKKMCKTRERSYLEMFLSHETETDYAIFKHSENDVIFKFSPLLKFAHLKVNLFYSQICKSELKNHQLQLTHQL